MSNTFGRFLKITTWGESHGEALGVVIDGCPAGLHLPHSLIENELLRDIPELTVSTGRHEPNDFKIMSGVYNNYTIGTPISIVIFNNDVDSSSYDPVMTRPRPGHGDLTWKLKYEMVDPRGGSRSSGRECIARLAAGAVARALLKTIGVKISSTVTELAGIGINSKETRKEAFEKVKELGRKGDSTGGKLKIIADNVPTGLGSPVFNKLQAQIGQAMLSIGGVKAIDIGLGHLIATKTGSAANDFIGYRGGTPILLSNNCGGILGGISTGNEINVSLSVKPTPTHRLKQKTIDLSTGKACEIQCSGRHDINFAPRVAIVGEAMLALVLADESIGCHFLPAVKMNTSGDGEK